MGVRIESIHFYFSFINLQFLLTDHGITPKTPATMASLPPTKRVRGALTSARHRLSRVMTPAAAVDDDADAENGRQSRLDRLTEATKRLSLVTPPQMIRVVDFAPGVMKDTVKIALLGNSGVGKTKLVQ